MQPFVSVGQRYYEFRVNGLDILANLGFLLDLCVVQFLVLLVQLASLLLQLEWSGWGGGGGWLVL